MTNPGFRYYSNELAEAITLSGQVVAQWAAAHVNDFLNKALHSQDVDYVIASDTDSIMVDLHALVDEKFGKNPNAEEVVKFLDAFGKSCLSVVLDRAFDDLAGRMNALTKTVVMKREAIADKAVWVGAKRYVMRILNNKGVAYTKPKLKIVGIEAVRSSTPTICRPAIKEAIGIIIEGNNNKLRAFLKEFRQKYDAAPLSDIARNSSVAKLGHYRQQEKSVPIAVKAALNFNDLLKKFDLQHKYPLIENGYKIKFVNLKEPNKYKMHVFGFPGGILPPELAAEFEPLVDRDRMYEDHFTKPLQKIAEACNMSLHTQATLEEFFL